MEGERKSESARARGEWVEPRSTERGSRETCPLLRTGFAPRPAQAGAARPEPCDPKGAGDVNTRITASS